MRYKNGMNKIHSLFLIELVFFILSFSTFAAEPKVALAKNPFRSSRLYIPNDGQPHPGVLLLHGSEGGSEAFFWSEAQYLAAHGYAALAFCYFDCGYPGQGPHQTLASVEIEKTFEALQWLKQSAYVRGGKTAIFGVSRGAEQSLLVASLSAEKGVGIDAILAHSPSDLSNAAWNWDWEDPKCWLGEEWSPACGPDPRKGPEGKPMWESLSAWKWKGVPVPVGERIKIENYSGPVFISVGTKDTMWPFEQTQKVEATLKKAGKNPEVHYFEGEDHIFGTEATNKRNQLILNFLSKVL